MGTRLFVGNLPYSLTDSGLHELFAEYGRVLSARVMISERTGESRGFGFVELSTGEEAKRAMQCVNGTSLEGRHLVVTEAKSLPKRKTRS